MLDKLVPQPAEPALGKTRQPVGITRYGSRVSVDWSQIRGQVGAIQSPVILLNTKNASSLPARPFGSQAYFDIPPSLMRTRIE